jgi:glycosyltransferase involved in cell wall biosynthesis
MVLSSEPGPTPTLSVLVLNYNYGHYLPGCLDSILAQSFTDFELIVTDDCSKDDSRGTIERYAARDSRIRPNLHEVNAGFARSLIEGTEELSRGEFLMVVSADDLVVHPAAFATQIELLRRHPRAAFCFSAVELIGPGSGERSVDQSYPEEVALEPAAALQALFDRSARPPHSGTMIRRQHYQACGGYRRDIKMALDLAIWVSLAIEGGFAYSPLVLDGYRVHESQMSAALPGIRRNAHEVKHVLGDAWREARRRGYAVGASERDVFIRHFEAYATYEAFNRGPRLAATRILATALESPLGAVKSRKLWLSSLRLALGPHAFDALRRTAASVASARRG